MATLYIITGPAGVGKSTISKQIANQSTKSVLIEGDSIYSQVIGGYISAWKKGNHLEIFWKICLDMIETYISAGYDVIFNYIITPNILEKIKNRFKNTITKFVVLLTDEETILKRDSNRPEDCQMKERCIILLNSFKSKNFDINHILDTTNLSIAVTVETIQTEPRFILNM